MGAVRMGAIKQFWARAWWAKAVVVMLPLFLCCGTLIVIGLLNPAPETVAPPQVITPVVEETPMPVPTGEPTVVEVTSTLSPSQTPEPATSEPTETNEPTPETGIPGLNYTNLRSFARREKMSCERTKLPLGWFCDRQMTRAVTVLQMGGVDEASVEFVAVEVTMLDGGDPAEFAVPLFTKLVAMYEEGGDDALAWVKNTSGQSLAEADFGSVHFIVRWDASGLAILDLEKR